MPLPAADHRIIGEDGLLTLYYLVAENIPMDSTLEQVTKARYLSRFESCVSSNQTLRFEQLFDAPAIVAKIKFIPDFRKLSSIGGSFGQRQHTPVHTALIAYYSEADAMRAVESLDGNDSLFRGEPLVLEYVGKGEEEKIIEDLRQRKLTNSVGRSAMLMDEIEEEETH